MIRLSIIVPIYNVEPFLERCIRSLENQDIQADNYEIICINDGSTDKSRDVIVSLQKEFDNIIFIEQQNQGVSAARNKGIDIAQGEYLLMVDPDDFLKPNILKKRLDILTNIKPDVGYTGHIILSKNLKEEYRFDPPITYNNVFSGIYFNNKFIRGKSEIRAPHSSVGIFFKTEFINLYNLRYLVGVPYLEDGELLARIACLADRVIFINEPFYMIVRRPGSANTSDIYHTEKARDGFLISVHNLIHFQRNHCQTEEQKIFINQPIVQFTIVYLISYEGIRYLIHYSKLYNSVKKGHLKVLHTEGCSDFYRRMGKAFNLSIHSFYFIWFLYKLQKSIAIRVKKILKLYY